MKYLNKTDFDNLGSNQNFKALCEQLYSSFNSFEYQVSRYKKLYDIHSNFNADKVLLFSSPGRIEVIGNHTDHNNGKVICAAISVDTVACVTPVEDNCITVASVGYPPVVIRLNDLSQKKSEYGTSHALVRGVCAYFVSRGFKIGGFYATTNSDVFKGAGVSSSACFEVLIAEILNVLYNESSIDAVTKALAAHHAESVYFGKPCGLMDQSAIALGDVSYIDFESPKQPKIETLQWPFKYDIILTNCGGDHCDLTRNYAEIREEMEAIAKYMNAPTLREASEEMFFASLKDLQNRQSGRSILRAMHYFAENKRVSDCAEAIKNKNSDAFDFNINQSGDSSYKLLQNCYAEGDLSQRIPLALAIIKSFDCVKASRVHGGGFAGTAIAFIAGSDSEKSQLSNKLAEVFGTDNVFNINIRHQGTFMVEI